MAKTARDIMQTPVLAVSPQDPIAALQRFFFDEGIHGAPVVDDERRVVGVISTTDLLRAITDRIDAARPHLEYASDGTEEGYEEPIAGAAGEPAGAARAGRSRQAGGVRVPSARQPEHRRA